MEARQDARRDLRTERGDCSGRERKDQVGTPNAEPAGTGWGEVSESMSQRVLQARVIGAAKRTA